jgi:hypothetical protein
MSIVKPRDQLSAFPWVCRDQQIVAKGMTLRDYFAAQAMQSLIQRDEANIAAEAYRFADAMLEARDAS